VRQLTWQQLGLPPDGPLGQLIEEHTRREKSEEEAVSEALTALALVAGVIATVATAGGALVVAAAATGVSAGLGVAQLAKDVSQYEAESAAGKVSIDPALADISTKEPELLPIVMDLVGIAMDVTQAIGIARRVSQAERALAGAGKMEEFAAQVRRLIPSEEVAARVIARAAQDATVMERVAAAINVVGSVAKAKANIKLAGLILEIGAENNVFAEWAAKLVRADRVCEMTEAAIRAKFANPAELNRALRALASMSGKNGFYEPTLKVLFVASRDAESMAATLVHEAVHYLQGANGQALINFIAEYQAFMAQRDYLLSVIKNGGTAPASYEWLVTKQPNEIARIVSQTYRASNPAMAAAYAIPASFNPAEVRQDLARMVTAALSGTP
jgi:hypothetical protein